MLFNNVADNENAAREEAEICVFGGILIKVRLVVVEKDGAFVNWFVRHFDGDGMDLVGIRAAAEAERGEAVVCTVWVELAADIWLGAVDGDFHNTALRPDDVVGRCIQPLVFEGDSCTVVKGEEIVATVEKGSRDGIVMGVFPPWARDVDGGMVERNRDDFFPAVSDHWFRKIGMRAFLAGGFDGGKGAFDGFQIEDVACIFIWMDAVLREGDLAIGIDEIVCAKVEFFPETRVMPSLEAFMTSFPVRSSSMTSTPMWMVGMA